VFFYFYFYKLLAEDIPLGSLLTRRKIQIIITYEYLFICYYDLELLNTTARAYKYYLAEGK